MTRQAPRVLATICARAGSKGVPGKNTRLLLGRPLLAYAIDSARACPDVERLVVSTDSDEVAAVAEAHGVAVPFRRPAEYATDGVAKILAIRHAVEFVERQDGYEPDIVVDLDVSAPLREPEDISACVRLLASNPSLDAAITMCESDHNPYFNMVEREGDTIRLIKPGMALVARQGAPAAYALTGSVCAWRRPSLGSATHLYEGRWGGVVVPRERAIDIDTELDFRFVEFLMRERISASPEAAS